MMCKKNGRSIMYGRILPVLPFVISSLVVSSILRMPRLLDFYRQSLQNNNANPSMFNALFVTSNDDVTTVNTTRPPLSSLIQDGRLKRVKQRNQTVIGDPQFLLDFAIVGFPKCGTSTLSVLLGAHPQALIKRMEMQLLSYSKPADAIWYLYTRLEKGNDYKRGYKSPFDVTNKGGAMDYMRDLFPSTKLIIGVRHPISWFESFYNFRIFRNVTHLPKPHQLLQRNVHGFGVKAANFHVHLSKLGKTSMTAPYELEMRQNHTRQLSTLPPRVPNSIFFYDVTQLADSNKTRVDIFRRDLQQYLGFREEMPSVPRTNQGKVKPPPSTQDYIDICDAQYKRLRQELLLISQRASIWIRRYFLDASDVTASSREYLEEIFDTWMYDPCENKRKEVEMSAATES